MFQEWLCYVATLQVVDGERNIQIHQTAVAFILELQLHPPFQLILPGVQVRAQLHLQLLHRHLLLIQYHMTMQSLAQKRHRLARAVMTT